MACLATLGTENDVALLSSYSEEKTDIKSWGMQVSTMGELAGFTSALLEKRIAIQKMEAEAKEKKDAQKNDAAQAPAENAAPAQNAAPAENAPAENAANE